MNKILDNDRRQTRRTVFKGKVKDCCILGVLALVLLFATWKIFYKDDNSSQSVASITASETELKIGKLLEEIDGVGKAEVVICETKDGVTGVVVVCEGANDFQVVMDIREAVAAALGTEQKAVKIYLKKE